MPLITRTDVEQLKANAIDRYNRGEITLDVFRAQVASLTLLDHEIAEGSAAAGHEVGITLQRMG